MSLMKNSGTHLKSARIYKKQLKLIEYGINQIQQQQSEITDLYKH